MPTTVPELLSLFGPGGVNGSVPPVLKRRTGELVAVIKAGLEATRLTHNPQGSMEDKRESVETFSKVVEESEVMSLTTPSSSAKPIYESRLWTVASSSKSTATISVSRSSLFDTGISDKRTQENGVTQPPSVDEAYFATSSTLFGSASSEVSFVA